MKLIRAQHRPWLIYAACSLISLAVMTSNLQGGVISNTVESYVLNMLTPLYSTINWGIERCHTVWNGYLYLVDLQQENVRLREEINMLKEQQVTLQNQALSAQRLESLIVQSCRMPGVKTRAHVVRRANSLLNATLLINAGSRQGFRQGLGVATADGVIGQIVRVGPDISKVLTLHHPDAGVGALLQNSRIQGVVTGTGTGTCIMRFVSRFDPVQMGEAVVTSGLDGAFPEGIPIGRVISIHRNPGDIFQRVEIYPVANLNSVEEVIVFNMPEIQDPEVRGPGRDMEHSP